MAGGNHSKTIVRGFGCAGQRRAHVALATLVLIIAVLLFGPLLLDASHDLADTGLDRLNLELPVHSGGVTK